VDDEDSRRSVRQAVSVESLPHDLMNSWRPSDRDKQREIFRPEPAGVCQIHGRQSIEGCTKTPTKNAPISPRTRRHSRVIFAGESLGKAGTPKVMQRKRH
jgi:hypothetical protein